MAMACIGVLSMVTHVRTFSIEKPFIQRELSNNIRLSAYFLAYNIVDLLWLGLLPLMYFVPYYFLTFPLTSFAYFYASGLMVCWWASGAAYVLSASPMALQWTNLIGVFIAVIFGAFINGLNPTIAEAQNNWVLTILQGISYNRWAMESLVIRELASKDTTMPNVVFSITQKLGVCDAEPVQLTSAKQIIQLLNMFGVLHESKPSYLNACYNNIVEAYMILLSEGLAFRLCALFMMWCSYDTLVQRAYVKACYSVVTILEFLKNKWNRWH
jgi:ABC-2 type transporter